MPQPQPYPTTELNNKHYFVTDKEVVYTYGFDNVTARLSPLLGIYDIEIQYFAFNREFPEQSINGKKSLGKKDDRVSETIFKIIEDFFENSSRVLIYVCDGMDKRDRQRQALFKNWHRIRGEKYNIDDFQVDIELEEVNQTLYSGLVTKKDFPEREVLESEFINKAEGLILEKFNL